MSKHTIEIAQSYAYEAWNQTDHADKLVQNARAELDGGDVNLGAVLDWFGEAAVAAELARHNIRSAITYLEALRDEEPAGG
ncbi:MAG: hypothetical protein P1V51_24510 [Deltaproteobacteria bacterium]|nr:hypothetical protein [Deltaproteobacteria bacterium]